MTTTTTTRKLVVAATIALVATISGATSVTIPAEYRGDWCMV